MMEQSLKYAGLGLPIFPVYEPAGIDKCSCGNPNCESIAKHPRTSNGLKDATTDETTIRKWWTQWPNASIGMATGVNDIGIIDLDGDIGLESGRKLGLQSPIKAITGGGGAHLWYRVPEGKKLVTRQAKKIAPGVDTRGTGGYILLPPSLHKSGRRYVWAGPLPIRSLLPSLPDLFIDKGERQNQGLQKANPPTWVEEAIARLRDGHVANTLVSILGKFRSANFSEEATYQLLKPHALEDGKPFEGLRDKITEIWRRYPINSTNQVDTKAQTIDTFLQEMETPEWICKPFIAKKSLGFVVGLPETLKTWLCIDMSVEAASGGGLWLGSFPITSCKVLFVDQERWRGETQRRFRNVIAAKGLEMASLKDRLSIKSGTTIRLNLDNSYQAFRSELMDMRPDLVVVDSFATFHTLPENDRSEIQKVLERIKELRNDVGCTFLFINHETKLAYPNGEPQGEPNAGTMAGSIGIAAAAEFILTVRKVEQGVSMIWHTKSTLASANKPFYASIKDIDNGVRIGAILD